MSASSSNVSLIPLAAGSAASTGGAQPRLCADAAAAAAVVAGFSGAGSFSGGDVGGVSKSPSKLMFCRSAAAAAVDAVVALSRLKPSRSSLHKHNQNHRRTSVNEFCTHLSFSCLAHFGVSVTQNDHVRTYIKAIRKCRLQCIGMTSLVILEFHL